MGWQIALALGLLIAITLLVFLFRKTRPYLFVGWLWYLSMLLPVIGIVQGIRAEMNYALIFDMDGQSSNVFLAVDPSLDVTAKVIERLKQPK